MFEASQCNDTLGHLLCSTPWHTTGRRMASVCRAELWLAERDRNTSVGPQPPCGHYYSKYKPHSGSVCHSHTLQNTKHTHRGHVLYLRSKAWNKCFHNVLFDVEVSHVNYLTPGAGVPFQAVLAGACVTWCYLYGAFAFTAVQWELSHVIHQANCCPGSVSLTTLSRALNSTGTHKHTLN